MGHSVHTTPARVRYHSTDLSCDVQKVYAYVARCACGWVGPRRELHREAQADAKFHRWETSPRLDGSATGGTEAS